MSDISYVAGQDVAARGIERHGAMVSLVLYYKLLTVGGARFVLVHLTAEGLVTDEDVVNDQPAVGGPHRRVTAHYSTAQVPNTLQTGQPGFQFELLTPQRTWMLRLLVRSGM
jgi:hypothetical protein